MLESLLVLAAVWPLVSGQVESTSEAQVSLRARARQLRRAELRGAQKARVIVIGAGLAGLEAANTLLDLDFQDFILLEVRITTVRLVYMGKRAPMVTYYRRQERQARSAVGPIVSSHAPTSAGATLSSARH